MAAFERLFCCLKNTYRVISYLRGNKILITVLA
nr:MAG TPA: hypothetical protein [Caudoviricetes sp.]